jgi:hypothetical protein
MRTSGRRSKKRLTDVRQHQLAEARVAGDAQVAHPVPHQVFGHFVDPFHALVDRVHFQEQPARFRRGVEPALDPLEEDQPQPLLRAGDEARYGRRGNLQKLGGAADRPGKHGGSEYLDLAQVQAQVVNLMLWIGMFKARPSL